MKKYTSEEDKYICGHFLDKTLRELGDHLKRPWGSVYGRIKRLGLILPDDLRKERMMIGIKKGWSNGQKTRFVKGQISWNKGLKDVCTGGLKSQFIKGNKPHNTKYDGCITIRKYSNKSNRPYLFIRLEEGKWELLHRYLWQMVNGPIPKKANVQFKDGNSLNCNINNLELISKNENMERNTINNLPQNLKDIILLNKQITKIIKEYEQRHVTRS
jgi:hypothetical protein